MVDKLDGVQDELFFTFVGDCEFQSNLLGRAFDCFWFKVNDSVLVAGRTLSASFQRCFRHLTLRRMVIQNRNFKTR